MINENHKQAHYSHLSLSDRIKIETGLNEGVSLYRIAKEIGKHPTTISNEIKNRRVSIGRRQTKTKPQCINYAHCTIKGLCTDVKCSRYMCRDCFSCKDICPDYIPGECKRLKKAPFVCNGCEKYNSCTFDRMSYIAKCADDIYHEKLLESRLGINQTPDHIDRVDKLISPLIMRGQSIAHIYSTHSEEIGCSRTTLYSYIDKGVFTARNIDLPRKVKYRPRKTETKASEISDGSHRIGRTYEDFIKYTADHQNLSVVEMDTVIGKRESDKVFLTLFFRSCSLMVIILLPEKSQKAVVDVLNDICEEIGIDTFKRLFGVILTDNGTEFQNNAALECDKWGEIKTRVFYCDPNCSWQKGQIEKNHEFIRYVIPKGTSFDGLSQEDVTLMTNHINSYARDSLNGMTPYKLSLFLLDNSFHKCMSLVEIPPDEV